MSLADESIEGGAKLDQREIRDLLSSVPGWNLHQPDGDRLVRSFEFADFASALAFTNRVGEIAEEAGHHPLITLTWGSAEVQWWSHSLEGLSRNDFIMAARTNRAAQQ